MIGQIEVLAVTLVIGVLLGIILDFTGLCGAGVEASDFFYGYGRFSLLAYC